MAKAKENQPHNAPVISIGDSSRSSRNKGLNSDSLGGCLSPGCKVRPTHMGFCDEHFDQFKFGLIKMTGAPVPDYEKKFEHYENFKRHRLPKAA